jgi:hypothetical protein
MNDYYKEYTQEQINKMLSNPPRAVKPPVVKTIIPPPLIYPK